MARGKSGRIVLEIDPALKRQLYLHLEQDQITLKDWFIAASRTYIESKLIYTVKKNNIEEYTSSNGN